METERRRRGLQRLRVPPANERFSGPDVGGWRGRKNVPERANESTAFGEKLFQMGEL